MRTGNVRQPSGDRTQQACLRRVRVHDVWPDSPEVSVHPPDGPEILQRCDPPRHLHAEHTRALAFPERLQLFAWRRDDTYDTATPRHLPDLSSNKQQGHRDGRDVHQTQGHVAACSRPTLVSAIAGWVVATVGSTVASRTGSKDGTMTRSWWITPAESPSMARRINSGT